MQISCNKLTVGYKNKKILENLNFSVNKKDYLVIIGHNGSGKSTLLKTLLGLIKPLDGTVINNIKSIVDLPQQDDILNDFPITCFEVVISGFVNRIGVRPFFNKEEKIKH